MYIKSEEMKRTQYAQSSHARVNQTGLCGVIGEEEEKKKWTISKYKRKERKKKERMINAECRDMDNPVNIIKNMTCCIDS
jgi:hypothetical protein